MNLQSCIIGEYIYICDLQRQRTVGKDVCNSILLVHRSRDHFEYAYVARQRQRAVSSASNFSYARHRMQRSVRHSADEKRRTTKSITTSTFPDWFRIRINGRNTY